MFSEDATVKGLILTSINYLEEEIVGVITRADKEKAIESSLKDVEDCWKNIRKRAIEKKKDLDAQGNTTGGGVAKKVAALTDLDEKVLSIIKYAEPLSGINDSNHGKNIESSESDSAQRFK